MSWLNEQVCKQPVCLSLSETKCPNHASLVVMYSNGSLCTLLRLLFISFHSELHFIRVFTYRTHTLSESLYWCVCCSSDSTAPTSGLISHCALSGLIGSVGRNVAVISSKCQTMFLYINEYKKLFTWFYYFILYIVYHKCL